MNKLVEVSTKLSTILFLLVQIAHAQQQVCNRIAPLPVTNLIAVSSDSRIDSVWSIPSNRPCDLTYEVTITATGSTAIIATAVLSSPMAAIRGLKNNTSYDIFVSAITPYGRSSPAKASATPPGATVKPLASLVQQIDSPEKIVQKAGWACIAITTPPMCPAATMGQCRPMTCADIKRIGGCQNEYMKTVDWNARSVTQYCSTECGCSALPSLRQSLTKPAADFCCAFTAGQYWS